MKKTLIAISLALAAPAALAGNVFVFGDSLSDVGQKGWADILDVQSHYHGVATYYNNDGTPNLLYDQIVADQLGGGTLTSRFPLTGSVTKATSINYAFSGAYIDPANNFWGRSWRQNHKGGTYSAGPDMVSNVLDQDHLGKGWHEVQPFLSIQAQINQYVQDVISGKYKPKAGDMFILWGGGNDVAAIMSHALSLREDPKEQYKFVKASLTHTAQALAREALTLKAFGGGQLLLVAPNLPNIVYTPEILNQMVKTVASKFYTNVRTMLAKECDGMACVLGYKAPETNASPGREAAGAADAFYVTFMKTYQAILAKDTLNSTQHSIQDLTNTRHQILMDLVDAIWDTAPIPDNKTMTFGAAVGMNTQLAAQLGVSKITKQIFTGYLIGTYDSLAKQAATVTAGFNQASDQALGAVGGYILRLNTDALFTDMLNHPDAYGFKNLVGSVCNFHTPYVKCMVNPTSPTTNYSPDTWRPTNDYKNASYQDGKLVPGVDGSAAPLPTNHEKIGIQAANGASAEDAVKTDQYFFTDPFHPSPLAHRIMADYLISAYNAPKAIIKLRKPFVSQVQSVSQDFMSNAAQNQLTQWALQFTPAPLGYLTPRKQPTEAISYNTRANLKTHQLPEKTLVWPNHRLDAQINYRYTTGGNNTLLVGLRGEVTPKVQVGALYRFAQFTHKADGVYGKGTLHALALNAQYTDGNYWVGGLLGYLTGQYDITRTVVLGPRVLLQTAKPPMKAYTASLFGGYAQELYDNWYASVSANLTYSLGLIKKYTEREVTPVQEGYDPQGFKVMQLNVFSQVAWKGPYNIVPHVRLGLHHIVHQWGNAIGAYLNGFHYGVERVGLKQDPNWVSTSVGVMHQPTNGRWYLSINLEKDFMRTDHNNLGVSAQAGIQF